MYRKDILVSEIRTNRLREMTRTSDSEQKKKTLTNNGLCRSGRSKVKTERQRKERY